MSFNQLFMSATVIRSENDPLHLVHEWNVKRNALKFQLLDFPTLLAAFKTRKKQQDPNRPTVLFIDNVPDLRLANACESTCNSAYSMAEVASSFANKISGEIPSSFNAFRKKVLNGKTDIALRTLDFSPYEKLREIRAEWTHHSSIFIGETQQGEPTFVLRSYRRFDDKKHFPKQSSFSVHDIIAWAERTISLLDSIGDYLLTKYVLPSFDLEAKFFAVRRDEQGFPIILPDGKFDGENMTIRDYFVHTRVISA